MVLLWPSTRAAAAQLELSPGCSESELHSVVVIGLSRLSPYQPRGASISARAFRVSVSASQSARACAAAAAAATGPAAVSRWQ